jgi:triosephosphate isomerase
MKKLIAANWKMNMTMAEAMDFVLHILKSSEKLPDIYNKSELLICAPYVYLSALSPLAKKGALSFGAQNCSHHEHGAYTGDISAIMLKDVGCSHVIIGHSERREDHNENNSLVNEKAKAVIENGLTAIICVGESLREREANLQEAVVERQLLESVPKNANAENAVIAYEPVWAIGTGKTPSSDDTKQMHNFIRKLLIKHYNGGENMRILYGGSMNSANAKDLLSMPNIDGGLIGSASLKVDDFLSVAKSA